MDEATARAIQCCRRAVEPGSVDSAQGIQDTLPQTPGKAARDTQATIYVRADRVCPDIYVNGRHRRTDGGIHQRGTDAFHRHARTQDKPYDSVCHLRRPGSPVVSAPGVMVRPQLRRDPLPGGGRAQVREPDGHRPFYKYYQIGGADESDEAETEPTEKGELKSGYEPSHSPFGFLWQIADATGWSIDYILHKVNYQTLIMMLSDAPRYRSGSGNRTSAGTSVASTPEEEANAIENFFVSNLKQ